MPTSDRYVSPLALFVCLVLGLASMGSTCATGSDQGTGADKTTLTESDNLRSQLRVFHKHMRWESFDRASSMVAESHRQAFIGRYEEHGDDYDIVDLRIKRVEIRSKDEAKVEVEQKWYVEPVMTVEEETFVEIWRLGKQGWKLEDRLQKDDWEARQQRASESTTQTD
jgi:hypothetical protein